jgi:hypothetical protein
MNQYEVTTKLWIKATVASREEAKRIAKSVVDEALYQYMQQHTQAPGENLSISKSKVIWAKDITPKEGK